MKNIKIHAHVGKLTNDLKKKIENNLTSASKENAYIVADIENNIYSWDGSNWNIIFNKDKENESK